MKWSSLGSSSVFSFAAVAAMGCAAAEPQVAAPERESAVDRSRVEETKSESQGLPDEGASSSKAKEKAVAKSEARELPTECANDGDVCTPPEAFVERLCKRTTPDLALTMFDGDSPWARAYVRGNIEAWYASARRSQPRQLRYAEEVIIVRSRSGGGGGIKISGSGNYDVYRFDGTCVSLSAGEVSMRPPSTPDVAPIKWRHLDRSFQTTLREHPPIAYRYDRQREACKGFDAREKPRCKQSTVLLSRTVADYVRSSGQLPDPPFIP